MPNLDVHEQITFADEFDAAPLDSGRWQYPSYTEGHTFIGRTQLRVREHGELPTVSNSNLLLTLSTHNPFGPSFLGTHLQSTVSFDRGSGLSLRVRARLRDPIPRGLIGGIFLSGNSGPGQHDEICFTMLSNAPGLINTNVFAHQPLGLGRQLGSFALPSGTLFDYHDYRIDWLEDRVEWFVDNELLRSETAVVPTGQMAFNLNLWAPDANWAKAYDSSLQPTASSAAVNYTMDVDSVRMIATTRSRTSTSMPAPMSPPMPSDADSGYIFISYKREDLPRVIPFLRRIANCNYPIWYDRGIPGTAEWDALIERKVQNCMVLVVFLSDAAVESKWVRREVKFADSEGRPILGVRLHKDVKLKHGLKVVMSQYQMIDANEADFSEELKKAIEYVRLL